MPANQSSALKTRTIAQFPKKLCQKMVPWAAAQAS